MIDLAPRHKRGLALPGRLMNAAGVLGFADEYRGLIDFRQLGALVTNPLTHTPRTPARGPNAVLLPDGLLIHTGLPNPGVRAAIRRHAREWARLGPPVIVHLAATSEPEVLRAVERLEACEAVAGIELGLRDDVAPENAARLVRAARGGLPLLVRLPAGRAEALAPGLALAGADALTVCAPPRRTLQLEETSVSGRFYGPGVFASALQEVRAVRALALETPLVGAGGLFSPDVAREMLRAGAAAVQVDAAVWNDPGVLARLAADLA